MHNWAQMKDVLTLQDEFCHFRRNSGGHFEKAVFPGFAPGDLRGFFVYAFYRPLGATMQKISF